MTLSNAVSITDPDDLDLVSATVAITGGAFAGDDDVLSGNSAAPISVNYNSTTETLTLTGTDTLAHYEAVLDSVTFSAGKNPTDFGSNPTRTVAWTLNDGSGSANGGAQLSTPITSTISLTNVDDPPTLSNVVAIATFLTGTLSPSLTVSDPDNLSLASATVQITGGSFAGDGDVLAATTTGTAITAGYNSVTQTLTLTGADTLAHYQSVLDSVTFTTGSNPSNSGSNPTRTLSWVVNDGTLASTAAVTTITTCLPRNDFNGDGKSDVLWQNSDGLPAIWEMNGTSLIGAGGLPNPGSSWQIEASADFNHDGRADIILQNTDGLPVIWEMNGTSIIGAGSLPNPGPSWHVIATGDFNADGNPDILWQNTDGLAVIWEMNGTSIIGGAALPNSGPAWHVIGSSDFNADGKADILWQSNDGLPVIWEMNGASIIGSAALPNPGPTWHPKDDGPIPSDQMAPNATPAQPSLHLSAPDAANAVPMLSAPDTATSNNTPAGASNSVISVNNTFVGAPPDGSGSGGFGTFGFNLSPPPGVSPQFAAVWTSLLDSPAVQSFQKLFTGGS